MAKREHHPETAAEWVEVGRLHGWDRNPRRHPDAQVRDLMRSIQRFGFGAVILARPNGEVTGRKCHAIELAPEYVDVAVKRWQAFTGKAAVLDGDGRTFAEIEGARAQTS